MTTDDQGGASAAVHTARDEAAGLAQTAAESGQGLLHEAKGQAGDVVAEATGQARDLLGEARAGLQSQASDQQARAAQGLRALGDQLGQMADGAQDGGVAADLVRQVAGRTGSVASWLEEREPGDLLHEVTDFARRKPGTFLAAAAVAGLLAGRLTRGIKDAPSGGAAPRAAATGPGTTAAPLTGGTTGGLDATIATAGGPGAVAAGTGTYDEADTAGAHRAPGEPVVGSAPATEPVPAPVWPAVDAGSSEEQAWNAAGGEAPVTATPGHLPGSDGPGTAGGDPLAGVRREDQP